LLPYAPGLQKVGENKTVGQKYVWGPDLLILQANYIIKAVRTKQCQNKKTADIVIAVAATVHKYTSTQVAKPLMEP
jgi:hypothetical protein